MSMLSGVDYLVSAISPFSIDESDVSPSSISSSTSVVV